MASTDTAFLAPLGAPRPAAKNGATYCAGFHGDPARSAQMVWKSAKALAGTPYLAGKVVQKTRCFAHR
eukprot:1216701-Amphidinium_carterae.1